MHAVAIPALSHTKHADGTFTFTALGVVRLGLKSKTANAFRLSIAFLYASDAGDDGPHTAHVVLRHADGRPILRQRGPDDARTTAEPAVIDFDVPPKPFSYVHALAFFAHLDEGAYSIVLTLDGKEVFTWPLAVIDTNKRAP